MVKNVIIKKSSTKIRKEKREISLKKKNDLCIEKAEKKKSVHTSVMKYGVDFKRKENKKYSFFHSSIFAPKKKKNNSNSKTTSANHSREKSLSFLFLSFSLYARII